MISYDLKSDCLVIYVCLGHVFTVFHCPDLPVFAPSATIQSYMMHVLLIVYMVDLDSPSCVWVVSFDLKSAVLVKVMVTLSFTVQTSPHSLPAPSFRHI